MFNNGWIRYLTIHVKASQALQYAIIIYIYASGDIRRKTILGTDLNLGLTYRVVIK